MEFCSPLLLSLLSLSSVFVYSFFVPFSLFLCGPPCFFSASVFSAVSALFFHTLCCHSLHLLCALDIFYLPPPLSSFHSYPPTPPKKRCLAHTTIKAHSNQHVLRLIFWTTWLNTSAECKRKSRWEVCNSSFLVCSL